MLNKEAEMDEALLGLLRECADINPPLTAREIIETFVERMTIEAPDVISASLSRLANSGAIKNDGKAFRLASAAAA